MKKALLTVIPERCSANTAIMMQSAAGIMSDYDRLVYFIDIDENELNSDFTDIFKGVKLRSAMSLFRQEYKDEVEDAYFYFTEHDICEYAKVKALKALLEEYDQVVIANHDMILCKKPEFLDSLLNNPNTAVSLSQKFFPNNDVPEVFLYSQGLYPASNLFAISSGKQSQEFVNWVDNKFKYLYDYRFSSIIDEHTPLQNSNQSEIINSWQSYSTVFFIKHITEPVDCITVVNNTKATDYTENPLFICFDYQEGKTADLHPVDNEKLKEKIEEYKQQVDELNKKYTIRNDYRFDYFSDGVKVHKLLRNYYFMNYRLRVNCKLHPFENRKCFTDCTVVTGEIDKIPINAMEEALWLNRLDLQKNYPNYKDTDRKFFTEWYIACAKTEYNLSDEYIGLVAQKYNEFVIARTSTLFARISARLPFIKCNPCEIKKFTLTDALKSPVSEKIKTYEPGINLCGYIRGDFGLGEATRILARTFDGGKIPYSLIDYSPSKNHKFTNKDLYFQISNQFQYNTNLTLVNPSSTLEVYETFSPDAVAKRYNIGFWYWELPEFPDRWVKYFDYFDEIWTSSEFSVECFKKKTGKPVYSVPCCITVDFDKTHDRQYFHLSENKFLFLMMYDLRSINQRKNPLAVAKAFVEAFGNRDDVNLVIKISRPSDWSIGDELAEIIKDNSNIIFVDGIFPKDDVNALINCCDSFVSLHRSEGFGLGPAEAMYLGKPTILTNWSGNTEYMTEDNCCPVNYEIVELSRDFPPYDKGSHWAEPDYHHAAQFMKRLVEDKEYYKKISENGERYIRENFSPEAISKLVIKRMKQIGLMK